jgi:hypothetical protein
MRYHKAGNTLAMLMDEAIPRRKDGALDLCAECQRWMWFSGGYLAWLANRLSALASVGARWDRIPKWVAQMEIGEKRQWSISSQPYRERTREKIKALAFKLGRTFRVRTWTHGLIEVWRLA